MRSIAVMLAWLMLVIPFATTCSERNPAPAATANPSGTAPAGAALLAGLAGLPAGAADQAGRHAISATDNFQPGSAAWNISPTGASISGTVMQLDSAPGGLAWALYQWSGIGGSEQLLQLQTDLATAAGEQGWLVLSNYSQGIWKIVGPLDGSFTHYDFTSSADFISPGGNTYAGLVVADGKRLDINGLNLRIEAGGGTVLFTEPFEDENYTGRGWYDSPGFALTTVEHAPGPSTRAVEFHFQKGQTKPTTNGGRVLFTGTDAVYASFWIKYSSDWTGSDKPYHPHEFHFVTNENDKWVGPAYTHLTTYIEDNEGVPLLAIQDGQNIDEAHIGEDLSDVTENRSVAGCNGSTDGYADDCYLNGAVHVNGKRWMADGVYFSDQPGPHYKSDWHFIEAYFKLNSIVAGKGVCDGVVRYWYDGELLINREDVLLRTGQHPGMLFNQFLVLPYIGDGSPIDQTMWLDNLTLATGRP